MNVDNWMLFNGTHFLANTFGTAQEAAAFARSTWGVPLWVVYYSPGHTLYAYEPERLQPLFAMRSDFTFEDLFGWDEL